MIIQWLSLFFEVTHVKWEQRLRGVDGTGCKQKLLWCKCRVSPRTILQKQSLFKYLQRVLCSNRGASLRPPCYILAYQRQRSASCGYLKEFAPIQASATFAQSVVKGRQTRTANMTRRYLEIWLRDFVGICKNHRIIFVAFFLLKRNCKFKNWSMKAVLDTFCANEFATSEVDRYFFYHDGLVS